MKNSKTKISLILVLICSTLLLCAWLPLQREATTGEASVVSFQTPTDTTKSGCTFFKNFANESSTSYNSSPILTEDAIYLVNKNTLYKMSYDGTIRKTLTLCASMNSVCYMAINDDQLYIPLSGGYVQCVKASTMTSLWQSASFGGQSLSTIFLYDGALYSGTTNASGTSGIFYCLDMTTGKNLWTYENNTGYYWSGAATDGNALYFAGDNGILISHSLKTDEVYDTCQLTNTAKIRSGIVFNQEENALYTASNDAILYKIPLQDNGTLMTPLSKEIIEHASSANCTSTPTICNGRLYIGCYANNNGYLAVVNADTLASIYQVDCGSNKEVKATPMISTAYATEANSQKVFVYFTANAFPGGIYMIEDSQSATEAKLQTLFTPATAKQFCLSSITSGTDGTLYYSNDSGTFFAVNEVSKSADIPIVTKAPTPTASPSVTPTPVPTKQAVKKPSKPTKLQIKKQKKKWKLSWKKGKGSSKTILYLRKGKKSWKKKLTTSRTKYSLNRQKGNYYIRLRSAKKLKNKWYYSAYTKTYRLK